MVDSQLTACDEQARTVSAHRRRCQHNEAHVAHNSMFLCRAPVASRARAGVAYVQYSGRLSGIDAQSS